MLMKVNVSFLNQRAMLLLSQQMVIDILQQSSEMTSLSSGDVGARLKALRVSRMLSQKAFAELVGVSKVTIWKWEQGIVLPRADRVGPLAEALGISTRTLGNILNMADQASASIDARRSSENRLTRMVLDARREIALEAGVDVSQVTILIAY